MRRHPVKTNKRGPVAVRVTAAMPSHCSLTQKVYGNAFLSSSSSNNNSNNSNSNSIGHQHLSRDAKHERYRTDISSNLLIFVLLVLEDGVAWREIRPLFFPGNGCKRCNDAVGDTATAALLDRFLYSDAHAAPCTPTLGRASRLTDQLQNIPPPRQWRRRRRRPDSNKSHVDFFIPFQSSASAVKKEAVDTSQNKDEHVPKEESTTEGKGEPSEASWHIFHSILELSHSTVSSSFASSLPKPRKNDETLDVLLLIVPPTPTLPHNYYTPSLIPEFSFSTRLITFENLLLKLITLNAYVATLGGGYFLCRYLSSAIRLARFQRYIAHLLGDVSLMGRCTVNEAYNYIHAGRFDDAIKLSSAVRKDAMRRDDQSLCKVADAALRFARRVRRVVEDEEAQVELMVKRGEEGGVTRNNGKNGKDCVSKSKIKHQRLVVDDLGEQCSFPSKMRGNRRGKTALQGKNECGNGSTQSTMDDFYRIRVVASRARSSP